MSVYSIQGASIENKPIANLSENPHYPKMFWSVVDEHYPEVDTSIVEGRDIVLFFGLSGAGKRAVSQTFNFGRAPSILGRPVS